jgi:hypothetical protein
MVDRRARWLLSTGNIVWDCAEYTENPFFLVLHCHCKASFYESTDSGRAVLPSHVAESVCVMSPVSNGPCGRCVSKQQWISDIHMWIHTLKWNRVRTLKQDKGKDIIIWQLMFTLTGSNAGHKKWKLQYKKNTSRLRSNKLLILWRDLWKTKDKKWKF